MAIFIGTAGWSIPRNVAGRFGAEGSALERYAEQLDVAEINSSFHRPHRISTWQRWRDSVPEHFRFSVKLPKQITHTRKLVDCVTELEEFLQQAQTLGDKLSALLVQLPPKLSFDPAIAGNFFARLVPRAGAAVACEPRHVSWFTAEASRLLDQLGVARVAADPAVCGAASLPGGHAGLSYWRLHGSPNIYRSSYLDRIPYYAAQLRMEAAEGRDVWCIFDNTASSAGASDALALKDLLQKDNAR